MKAIAYGDFCVYPGHGVGRVTGMESKDILGKKTKFYIVSIIDSALKIMVPVETMSQVGLRPISSKAVAKKAIDTMRTFAPKVPDQQWNKRYRELMGVITQGDIIEISKAYVQLITLRHELSFGERKMVDCIETLLISELALSLDLKRSVVEHTLLEIMNERRNSLLKD